MSSQTINSFIYYWTSNKFNWLFFNSNCIDK